MIFNDLYFSVFGKTMESTRGYCNIDLMEIEAKAEKLTKQASYRANHIFHDNIAVERYQTSVKMDKPIYTCMYAIYTDILLKSCSNHLSL